MLGWGLSANLMLENTRRRTQSLEVLTRPSDSLDMVIHTRESSATVIGSRNELDVAQGCLQTLK